MSQNTYPNWIIKHKAKIIDIQPGHERTEFHKNMRLREKYAILMGVPMTEITMHLKKEMGV